MKLFKWWHILLISFGVLVICGLFFLVAFKSKDEDVNRWSLFSSMIIGTFTLSFSFIALLISIQTFVKTSKQEKEQLINDAKTFISNNNAEIDYIPLCLLANNYDNHRKYNRTIYNSFNLLKPAVQKEVLNQLNYDGEVVWSNNWLRDSKNRINAFIEKYNFGDNFLFEFFEKSLNYSEVTIDITQEQCAFIPSRHLGYPSLSFKNGVPIENCCTLSKYLTLYLNAQINKNNNIRSLTAPKPLDLLLNHLRDSLADEIDCCFWSLSAIDAIAKLIMENPSLICKDRIFSSIHADINTYEDRFLLSLSILFNLSKYVEK